MPAHMATMVCRAAASGRKSHRNDGHDSVGMQAARPAESNGGKEVARIDARRRSDLGQDARTIAESDRATTKTKRSDRVVAAACDCHHTRFRTVGCPGGGKAYAVRRIQWRSAGCGSRKDEHARRRDRRHRGTRRTHRLRSRTLARGCESTRHSAAQARTRSRSAHQDRPSPDRVRSTATSSPITACGNSVAKRGSNSLQTDQWGRLNEFTRCPRRALFVARARELVGRRRRRRRSAGARMERRRRRGLSRSRLRLEDVRSRSPVRRRMSARD